MCFNLFVCLAQMLHACISKMVFSATFVAFFKIITLRLAYIVCATMSIMVRFTTYIASCKLIVTVISLGLRGPTGKRVRVSAVGAAVARAAVMASSRGVTLMLVEITMKTTPGVMCIIFKETKRRLRVRKSRTFSARWPKCRGDAVARIYFWLTLLQIYCLFLNDSRVLYCKYISIFFIKMFTISF